MSSHLGVAVSGAKLMVLLQLVTRVATFVLNALVVRHVAPEVVGSAAQLQLITAVTLFLSREAPRRIAQRTARSFFFPAGLLSVALGAVACVAVATVWRVGAEELAVPHFALSLRLTLAAAMLELCGEVGYARNVTRYRARFWIESCSFVAMAVTLFVGVRVLSLGLLAWGVAQCVFAAVSTAGNLALLLLLREPGPAPGPASPPPPGSIVRLLGVFQWQAVQQLVMQEGERVVLKLSTASLAAQGSYAVVSGLGSLLVRSLFLPVEDVASLYFARLLSASASPADGIEAATVLRVVLRLLLLAALFLLSLGPPLSFLAIDVLYGPRLSASDAPAVLAAFCGYVVLLGLNGLSEAFVRAKISAAEQSVLNVLQLCISGVHLAACYVLLERLGAVGLVVANCTGVALRIAYSAHFIAGHVEPAAQWSWRAVLPSWPVVAALALARLVLTMLAPACSSSGGALVPSLPCLGLAGAAAVSAAATLLLVYRFDGAWWRDLVRLFARKTA